MDRISKPTLKDYREFAEKIGFKDTKIDGIFLYKCGETILRPFELGNLYRLCHLKGVDDCLRTLEYYVKKSKNNKELKENLNEYIKYMKESSEVNKNKLK